MAAAFQNLVTFPATVDFVGPSYNEPQTQILGLFNKNKTHRISFKIQANCRRHVDVSQVFGFVEPHGNCAIILTCKAMDAVDLSTRRKKHLTIISCDAQAFTGVNSERFWRQHATNPNSSRLQSTYVPVNFWKDGAAHQAAQKGPISMCTTFMGGANRDQRMMSLYRVAEPGARPEELLVTALPAVPTSDQGQGVEGESPPSGSEHNNTDPDNLSQMKTFQVPAPGGSAPQAASEHTAHNGHTYSGLSGVTAVSGRHVSTVTAAPKSATPAATAVPKSLGALTSTHSSASGYSTSGTSTRSTGSDYTTSGTSTRSTGSGYSTSGTSPRSTGSDYSTTTTTTTGGSDDNLPRLNISLKGWGSGWGWGGNKTGAPASDVTTTTHSSASGYSTCGTSAYSSRSTGSGYTTTGTSQASKADSVNVTHPPVAIPPVGHASAQKSVQTGPQSQARGAGPLSRNAGAPGQNQSRQAIVSEAMGGGGGTGLQSTYVVAGQTGATGGMNATNQGRPGASKNAGAAGKAPKSGKPVFSQRMGADKDVEQNRAPPRSMFVQVKGAGADEGFKSEQYLDPKM